MSSDANTPRPGLWRWSRRLGDTLNIGLGLISPAAVFVVLRVGVIGTGVPWHPVVSVAVVILAVLVALGSLTMIVFGYGTRGMRSSSIAMTVWGVLSVIPVTFALFITTYGDPAPPAPN